MIETIMSIDITNEWVVALYWLPFCVCFVVYAAETWRNCRDDLTKRREYEEFLKKKEAQPELHKDIFMYYYPHETVGTVMSRVLVTVCPVVNLVLMFVDTGRDAICFVMRKMEELLTQPLFPPRGKK